MENATNFEASHFFAHHYIETLFSHVRPLAAKGEELRSEPCGLTYPRRCSMEFLHSEFDGGPNDTVLVTLDAQANVMLLDENIAYVTIQKYNWRKKSFATTARSATRCMERSHTAPIVDGTIQVKSWIRTSTSPSSNSLYRIGFAVTSVNNSSLTPWKTSFRHSTALAVKPAEFTPSKASSPAKGEDIRFQNLTGARKNVQQCFGIDLSASISPTEWH